MEPQKTNNRAVLGIILILVGAVLIAGNLSILPHAIPSWVFSWRMLLIVIGLLLLATKQNKGPGIVLILIGGFFIADQIFDNYYNLHRVFWPSLIILVGVMFLFKGRRTHFFGEDNELSNDDLLDDTAVFGGGQKVITSKNFKGGRITSVFGGSTIDLSQAQLAKGINVIDFASIFGGSKIIVPRDWDIHLEVTAIFGGFSDKRIIDPHIVHDPTNKLVIKGVAIFGGGEVTYIH